MFNLNKIFFPLLFIFLIFICADFNFAQIRIALLYSELTETHSIDNPEKVIEDITSWELFLMQNKIPYEVIYNNDLESGIEDDFDILILPSVEIISKAEFDELQNFLIAGKSIISVGSKLFYSAKQDGNFNNLKSLFNLNEIEFINKKNTSFNHSIIPNHLNHFIDNEYKVIQITNKNAALECSETAEINNSCGYIISDKLDAISKSSMVYGVIGNGKYFWSGFGINDIIGGKSDLLEFKKIILDAIYWMDSKPEVYLKYPFDDGFDPALLTVQYNNALQPELIQLLIQNDFPPYLIIDPQIKYSKEIVNLFNNEKIILDLRSGQSNKLVDIPLVDLIARFEEENDISAQSIILQDLNIKSDILYTLKEKGIVNIIYYTNEINNPEFDKDGFFILPFSGQTNYLNNNGPISFFNYIGKNNCDEKSEEKLINSLIVNNTEKVKFTNLDNISSWWRNKRNLGVKISYSDDNKIEITADNRNPVNVENIQIFFNPGNIYKRNNHSITSNNTLVSYYKDSSGSLVINLGNMGPRSNKKFIVTFNEE